MSEKKPIEIIHRQRADKVFSIAPLQRKIDERLAAPVHNTFSVNELKKLGKRVHQEVLRGVHKDSVYGAEVLIPLHDDAYIYDMEANPPLRMTVEDATLYGYVNGFVVAKLPDQDKVALSVAFEEYSDDIAQQSHSYLVPMVITGTQDRVKLVDAPSPVADGDIEVATRNVQEASEQAKTHSLLNIIENDLFDDDTLSLEVFEESIAALREAGFVEHIDDVVTACNYFVQKCLHGQEPWLVRPEGVMERMDDSGRFDAVSGDAQGAMQWVSEELTVVGMTMSDDRERGIHCQIYARSDDGVLYRRHRDDAEDLMLHRDVREDETDEV